jgi:hypothetical protein
MKRLINIAFVVVLAAMAPVSALAHAGHGHENPLSPGHYVVNPEHSIYLGIIVVGSIVVAWMMNKIARRVQQ